MDNAEFRARWSRRLLLLLGGVVLLAACGSDDVPSESANDPTAPATSSVSATALDSSVTIPNDGGSLEGHTPRGFNGMGTGLFAGDELNSNFPPDDGVQIWLTFAFPADVATAETAELRSDALTVRGNPFEALGPLEIAPVQFAEFSPAVVDLEPVGPTVTCPMPEGSSFRCDATDAVQTALDAGDERVQLRLRFAGVSDPDGEQDMALFFLSDSNTNEPGIFELVIE